MELQISKEVHISFFTVKRKNIHSLTLVTFIPSTEKFTATSFSFLYAKNIRIIFRAFIVYFHSKCLQKLMQPNIRYLIFASCLLNKQKQNSP